MIRHCSLFIRLQDEPATVPPLNREILGTSKRGSTCHISLGWPSFLMKIITSIPPRFSRKHPFFRMERGHKYLAKCIESWRRNGFNPISVNRPDEVDAIKAMDLIDVVGVPQDEAMMPHRYGPCLGSIFDTLEWDAPVAIINADIYMRRGIDLAGEIAALAGKALIAARRTDVKTMRSRKGYTYPFGYDFFAFTPSCIPKTMRDRDLRRFQLGVPWWDYVFPIMASNEAPGFRIREPFIVHQKHDERWNRELYEQLAAEACHTLHKIHEAYAPILDSRTDKIADPTARFSHRLLFYPGLLERSLPMDAADIVGSVSDPGSPYWVTAARNRPK